MMPFFCNTRSQVGHDFDSRFGGVEGCPGTSHIDTGLLPQADPLGQKSARW